MSHRALTVHQLLICMQCCRPPKGSQQAHTQSQEPLKLRFASALHSLCSGQAGAEWQGTNWHYRGSEGDLGSPVPCAAPRLPGPHR